MEMDLNQTCKLRACLGGGWISPRRIYSDAKAAALEFNASLVAKKPTAN